MSSTRRTQHERSTQRGMLLEILPPGGIGPRLSRGNNFPSFTLSAGAFGIPVNSERDCRRPAGPFFNFSIVDKCVSLSLSLFLKFLRYFLLENWEKDERSLVLFGLKLEDAIGLKTIERTQENQETPKIIETQKSRNTKSNSSLQRNLINP